MNKFTPFVEWLWSKRDVPYTFRTAVLTEANRRDDPTVPVPVLTIVEAENLFQLLARKDLVFFQAGADPSYLLNKVEPHKWQEFIAEMKMPDWKRSRWYRRLMGGIWYVVVAFIAGIIGGLTARTGTLVVDHVKENISKPVADSPAKLPTNKP